MLVFSFIYLFMCLRVEILETFWLRSKRDIDDIKDKARGIHKVDVNERKAVRQNTKLKWLFVIFVSMINFRF